MDSINYLTPPLLQTFVGEVESKTEIRRETLESKTQEFIMVLGVDFLR